VPGDEKLKEKHGMKVNVEFLSLQLITQALGKKKIDVDFTGRTFSDLLAMLAGKVKRFKDMVLEKDGTLAYDIQVYINGEAAKEREELPSRVMSDGESITFMFLLGGG
jgi:hypothetical protein